MKNEWKRESLQLVTIDTLAQMCTTEEIIGELEDRTTYIFPE